MIGFKRKKSALGFQPAILGALAATGLGFAVGSFFRFRRTEPAASAAPRKRAAGTRKKVAASTK